MKVQSRRKENSGIIDRVKKDPGEAGRKPASRSTREQGSPRGDKQQYHGAGKPHGGPGYRQAAKPLDIPKTDPVIAQKEERSESRREYAGRDLERDVRREQRREVVKTQQGKPNKKIKPTNIGLAGKKGVSEILSKDFILNEFYDKRIKKKKLGKPRERKNSRKHIPPSCAYI